MVAKPGSYQTSFNAGELAPELHGRTDLKQFYAGAARMLNVEPVPQGGGRLAPRSRHLSRIRNALTLRAPDGSSQSLGPHAGAATIKTITFSQAKNISVVRMVGLSANVAIAGLCQVEYNDGAAWRSFGGAFSLTAGLVKTHTAALAPRLSVAAVGIRLRQTGAPASPATYTLASLDAYEEGDAATAVRLKSFTFSEDQSYVAVFTGDNADIFRDGVFVGAAASGFAEDKLALLNTVQRFDTMIAYHNDVATKRILRNGADDEWPVDDAPFENIPNADLGGVYSNATSDVWSLHLSYPTTGIFANGAELYFKITVDGVESAAILTGGAAVNWATVATAIENTLEAMPVVENGVSVAQGAVSGLTIFTITFGGDNVGRVFSISAAVTNTSAAAAQVNHNTIATPAGEPLISSTAGYPACAAFYQDRLVSGGFRSKLGAWLAGVTGEYFDWNTEIAAASGAILINLDTDGAERLHQIVRGTHLVLFTTDGEYFVSDRALSRTETPNLVNSSRIGAAEGVPVLESEGELIFVSQNAALVYGSRYDDVAQKYVSDPLSLLASHIANGVIDQAMEKSQVAAAANRLWQVRSDGTMALGILIRGQDVTAFGQWETDGLVKAVCVDGANAPHIAVERDVDGVAELHLERLELGLIFDDVVTITNSPAATTVEGLEIHEGAEVWARADGHVVGPFTVTDGAIELANAAASIDVGRWTAPIGRSLPLPSEVAERIVLRRPKRVHTVRIDLIDTTSVAIGANGQAADNVTLYHAGDPTDDPLAPFTGLKAIEGLVGYSDEGQVEITQTRPGLLQWRGLTIEART
jgi:hypothetical protein